MLNMTNEEVLQAIAHLIGTPYEPSVKDTITAITGRDRVVGPGEASTREYDSNSIHIITDANRLIESFSFK